RGRAAQAGTPSHVKFTKGMTVSLLLAAEMKILVARVADGPAAIAGQQRDDRLSLRSRNN
ncbi:MAG TPA: hypothetical protein VF801_00925, partial [Rhodocyclaceae bacterium]